MYRMYTYKDNGDRDEILYFDNFKDMVIEYLRRFRYDRYSLNPLCWEKTVDCGVWDDDNESRWSRIAFTADFTGVKYYW